VIRFMLSATILMLFAGCSTTHSQTDYRQSPLPVVSCPPLTPLADSTFAATTEKLLEVVAIYYECRAAALSK
jgi:hypothetical protein